MRHDATWDIYIYLYIFFYKSIFFVDSASMATNSRMVYRSQAPPPVPDTRPRCYEAVVAGDVTAGRRGLGGDNARRLWQRQRSWIYSGMDIYCLTAQLNNSTLVCVMRYDEIQRVQTSSMRPARYSQLRRTLLDLRPQLC